jgi:hypothetical protein
MCYCVPFTWCSYACSHAYRVYNSEQSNSTYCHVQAAAAVGVALDELLMHAMLQCAIDIDCFVSEAVFAYTRARNCAACARTLKCCLYAV